MNGINNETPIEHTCRNGTVFRSSRADLADVVQVKRSSDWPQTCADFAEFGAWHAMEIWPHLNGFQGYDCVRYRGLPANA